MNLIKKDSIKSQYKEEMNKEIETYKENHLMEMDEEINKLKEFHINEIKSFESKLYLCHINIKIITFIGLVDSNPELIECLKEDMDIHISNLRADYEEKLEVEIFKIKKKYQMK